MPANTLDQKETPLDRSTSDTTRPDHSPSDPTRLDAPHASPPSPRLSRVTDSPVTLNRPLMNNATNEATTLYRPITLVYMAAIVLLMVPVLTLVDTSVAKYFEESPLPRDVDSALELSLVFSHGTGVFFVLMTIMLLAPRMRWQVPRLATLALGGGAVATITKWFVLRPRPSSLNLEYVGNQSAWLWAFDWNLSEISAFDASTRAFPSANVVTATALTIGLWIMLPRGRVLFATIWVGVLLQRLHTGAHFLSDACGGVAIGLLWSFVCYHPKLMGTLFDRMAPEPGRRRRRVADSLDADLDASAINGDRERGTDSGRETTPDDYRADRFGIHRHHPSEPTREQTHFDERAA